MVAELLWRRRRVARELDRAPAHGTVASHRRSISASRLCVPVQAATRAFSRSRRAKHLQTKWPGSESNQRHRGFQSRRSRDSNTQEPTGTINSGGFRSELWAAFGCCRLPFTDKRRTVGPLQSLGQGRFKGGPQRDQIHTGSACDTLRKSIGF